MDAILGEITLHKRRMKLDEMTKGEGLGEAYAATLSRMREQPGGRLKLGMDVLMWVSHAERPLRVDELCHALGVEKGSADLNIRNIPAIETLLAYTLGLVTVEKSSSTVRLIHYTLQEYLSHNPNLLPKPHSTIAEVCLTYLNFRHVCCLSPTLYSIPSTAPFVEYAACYWGTHVMREATENVKTLALKLLDRFDQHVSSKVLLLHGARLWEQLFGLGDTAPRGFTGLHGAAYLGCVEIMVALLETNKWDVQATDLYGNTAIAWAARRGHVEAVRVLLERSDVNPNKASRWDRTPFWLAAENGHEGVARTLLARDGVNPDQMDDFGETPLFPAARNGHEGIVRMLLERDDINPDKVNELDRTPLWYAVENGQEGAVKMLLARDDVNPDQMDDFGENPLFPAARNGHEGIVRMLLERDDINPDKVDKLDRTPLWYAVKNGQEGAVKMLLARDDVNPDQVDQFGENTLFQAARNGREGIVRMLLARDDVNPTK